MKTRSIFYRALVTMMLLTVVNCLRAQQIPLYSQYYFNKFLYNPALTGQSGSTEGYLFGRRQYVNIDGYQTSGIAISGAPKDGKIGLGAYYINDVNQLQVTNSFYGNYAYNLKLGDQSQLSFGLGLGVVNNQFNLNNIITTDPNDPVLRLLDRPAGAVLDASIGVNVKLGGFNFGISLPQFLSNSQKFTDHYNSTLTYDLQNHLTIMTSYDILVNDELKIQPLVLFKNTANSPGQVDISVVADWMNKGWLGFGVRDGYGVSFLGGIQLGDAIRFGYAYDVSTGQYSTALGGSHEILLGAVLGKKKNKEKDAEMEAMAAANATRAKEQEAKIRALEVEVDAMKNRPTNKDTVIVIKKIIAKAPAAKPSGETSPTGDGKETIGDKVVGEFLVIAGSFTQESNATIYFNQLVNKNLSPYMYFDKGTSVYYVHLGKFYFKEDAREYLRKNATGALKLWVKTIK